MNPLKQLEACGQSPWLDYLKRSLIEKGELRTMIERDGLKGITSNPSIFEKAIGESDEYKDALKQFQTQADHSISDIYEHLAIADIRAAADVLRPVYDKTQGRDGYISLECSPYLANDTDATIAEALHLRAAVDRPNLMVKVPATPAGIPAIRLLIGRGLNINITLLFSVSVYEQVVEAYISGLEDLQGTGGDVSKIGGVASIFVSRIDVAVDKRLDELGDKRVADRLRGKAAIANAKIAYGRYKALFSGPRWQSLAELGAKTQRLLWASTSTKSPAYKDTMYVEALIGRDTVDTIPPSTMDAFRDHGEAIADSIEQDLAGARAILGELERRGISLTQVTGELVTEGVQQFADSFDKLFGAISRQRRVMLDGDRARLEISPGSSKMKEAFDAEMEAWRVGGRIRRLWAGDTSLWTGTDESKWLGWLNIVEHELADVDFPVCLCKRRKAARVYRHRVAGDGRVEPGAGSVRQNVRTAGRLATFSHAGQYRSGADQGDRAGYQSRQDAVHRLIEIRRHARAEYFPRLFPGLGRRGAGQGQGGRAFCCGDRSGLVARETRERTRLCSYLLRCPLNRRALLRAFEVRPRAGGGDRPRRAAPARDCAADAAICGADVPPVENPGVQLGVAMGVAAARFGRDKVTIIASPGIADLGAWLEQLLAESTGKQGRGLIPIADEPLTTTDHYGGDRFFAYLELDDGHDPSQRQAIAALEDAGHPVTRIRVKDAWHIGQEFFRWEIAVAVAGAIIGIDPFNQPDVEASKIKTSALTAEYEESHRLQTQEPVFRENGLALYADPRNAAELGQHNTLTGYLKSHFGRVHTGDYVALLAYVERDEQHTQALTAMRAHIRDKTRAATCLGFGPRFQHSTGQAYKGGPNSGVFLQVTCDDPADIDVPGHSYSFGVVKAAQASGDLEVLVERGRRALRVHLKDVGAGLAELARATDEALN